MSERYQNFQIGPDQQPRSPDQRLVMNFNVLQLISSTKLLIACKRIKNNCFDKFRQNEEKKRGKPKQSFMYRG